MANAIAAVSITDERYTWTEGNKYIVIGNLAVTASTAVYVTGGIAMNLFNPLVKASRTPIWVDVNGQSGYVYLYVPGVDASAGLLKIFQQSAATSALTEIPAAAIPAGVSNDVIVFQAIFNGQN